MLCEHRSFRIQDSKNVSSCCAQMFQQFQVFEVLGFAEAHCLTCKSFLVRRSFPFLFRFQFVCCRLSCCNCSSNFIFLVDDRHLSRFVYFQTVMFSTLFVLCTNVVPCFRSVVSLSRFIYVLQNVRVAFSLYCVLLMLVDPPSKNTGWSKIVACFARLSFCLGNVIATTNALSDSMNPFMR